MKPNVNQALGFYLQTNQTMKFNIIEITEDETVPPYSLTGTVLPPSPKFIFKNFSVILVGASDAKIIIIKTFVSGYLHKWYLANT